jgi:serine/threonine protein phosphatase PrpC
MPVSDNARHGVVVYVDADNAFARVLSQTGHFLPFLLREWRGPRNGPERHQPVRFTEAPHPREQGRLVARDVRPVDDLPRLPGSVMTFREGGFGFVRLDDGRSVYFNAQCIPVSDLRHGDRVECMVVPGREAHTLFALSLTQSTAVQEVGIERRRPALGAWTQKGTRGGKSVNDDGFLVWELAGGEMWLLAVVDGLSQPPRGWWASDKCLELLWRWLAPYQEQLLQTDNPEQVMDEWIDTIHYEFGRERRQASVEYHDVSSTLTVAVVRGGNVYYAHCGDTRLYIWSPMQARPRAVILDPDITASKGPRGELRNHIAAYKGDWAPMVGKDVLPPGGMLLLCSDGVVGGKNSLQKFDILTRCLTDRGSLQQRTRNAVQQIGAVETDDLTLITFQPGDE